MPGVFVVETTVLENSVRFLIGCTSNGHQAELSLANGPEFRHMRADSTVLDHGTVNAHTVHTARQ
jgi:hypothetical protein